MNTLPSPVLHSSEALPFGRLRIGLSVSNSPDDDLAARGLSREQLEQVFLEIVRDLMAGGASLAYGGDLRLGGFSQRLFDFLSSGDPADQPAPDRICNYLTWPSYLSLNPEERERLQNVVRIIEVPPPGILNVPTRHCLASETATGRHIRSRCLTAMRVQMNEETDARIVLGGAVTGFLGRYPGVAEETFLTLSAGKPVYLLGGFGGCTAALIEALCGGEPPAPPAQYHQPSSLIYAEMPAPEPPDSDSPADYPALLRELRRMTAGSLNNGLSQDENHRLLVATSAAEALPLIARGLANASSG
jgi:hypothetical protein